MRHLASPCVKISLPISLHIVYYPTSLPPHTHTYKASLPHSGTRTAAAASGLHDLLASFPPGLRDLRHNARLHTTPSTSRTTYSEPAFSAKRRKRSITLHFRLCGRADLAWSVTVKAASCGKQLNVGDVLKAISTELLGRSVCRDLREGELCYSDACKAQRVRTRRGIRRGRIAIMSCGTVV